MRNIFNFGEYIYKERLKSNIFPEDSKLDISRGNI